MPFFLVKISENPNPRTQETETITYMQLPSKVDNSNAVLLFDEQLSPFYIFKNATVIQGRQLNCLYFV